MRESEEVKSKSRRDDSKRKEESKRSSNQEHKDRERNGEKERHRRRDKDRDLESRRSDREKTRDKRREKDRRKDRDEERDRKRRRKEKEQKKASDGEPDIVPEQASTKEEDMEEEQKKLDEEVEKQRRRVQEWQDLILRRKKEEEERVNDGDGDNEDPKAGKAWTLEGESDDEEATHVEKLETDMDVDGAPKTTGGDADGVTIDPLDAFMSTIMLEVEQLTNGVSSKKCLNKGMGRIMPEDDSSDYEEYENVEPNLEDKKTKVEKLALVDHSKIEYPPFRKNFYIEVKEIAKMNPDEVFAYRKQLELKVNGRDVPKPVKTWHQSGLATKILQSIKKMDFEKPMPIQAQALPVIMSGRDCFGIAKTGSGKTLAFVLPMLRHIKDQPPLMSGDGPIGLIMAPTRELVLQIHNDIRKFAKVVGLTCVPVHGGFSIAQQISDLKRGAEIVVCTPGRMIDILSKCSGKITNLYRVTYLVIDEADRMFDLGFEPQITRIIQNTRPNRQTVLFSATFPPKVEVLARKVLNHPVEIQVGGRSVVNKDITQMVEMRPENERFLRLLEILGEWCEKGKNLIFVCSQEKCDQLFNDLLKRGHPCLSLHGDKDQSDRESTISDFKTNVCNILIATSIASRGLDVKELELVINYDVPNHYEEYVHRVGRTGRAGRKGMAITFISEEEARYAPDLVKALELSNQPIPDDLKALSDGFMAKVKEGLEKNHGTGYGGSGFKFNEEEDEVRKAAKKAQAKEYGFEEDKSDSEDEDEGIHKANGDPQGNLQQILMKLQAEANPEHYEAELEINDFPQNARWTVTHKETLGPISEWSGATITTKGMHFPQGRRPGPGDRKLYLYIVGPTEQSVNRAKAELKRVLENITTQATSLPGATQPGRYSVL